MPMDPESQKKYADAIKSAEQMKKGGDTNELMGKRIFSKGVSEYTGDELLHGEQNIDPKDLIDPKKNEGDFGLTGRKEITFDPSELENPKPEQELDINRGSRIGGKKAA